MMHRVFDQRVDTDRRWIGPVARRSQQTRLTVHEAIASVDIVIDTNI